MSKSSDCSFNFYNFSVIENNCTEDFAEHIDGEAVVEKNTFDGFKVNFYLKLVSH